jgi:hypothetical protein
LHAYLLFCLSGGIYFIIVGMCKKGTKEEEEEEEEEEEDKDEDE